MATVSGTVGQDAAAGPAGPAAPSASATAAARSATGRSMGGPDRVVAQALGVQPHLGPAQHPTEHLGLPAVELGPGPPAGASSPAADARPARIRAKAPPSGTPSPQAAAITMIPPSATTRSAAAMPLTAW